MFIVYYLVPKGLNDEQTLSLLTNNICAQLEIAGAKVINVLEKLNLYDYLIFINITVFKY